MHALTNLLTLDPQFLRIDLKLKTQHQLELPG